MSGGSWDYLYSQVHDMYWHSTFETVASRLLEAKTVHAMAAATEAQKIASLFKEAHDRWLGLWDVLHEMEWEDSGDSSPPDLANAIDKWAAEHNIPAPEAS